MTTPAQLALDDDWRPIPPGESRAEEIDRRAREFVEANPEVWRLYCKYALELISRGWSHYSSDAVVHRIRWHHAIETTDRDFKINDHYTAPFARMFHRAYPEHAGFFRLRERPSEE